LRRVRANLKRYRAAILKAACEGRLVPTEAELAKAENPKATFESGEALLTRILTERRQNWQGRGQYKEPDALDTANLPPPPDGWIWTNLDTAIVSGPQNGVYLPREYYGSGHAILRIDDYQDGWVRGVDELNKVTADQATSTKYQLLSGDLVINRVNSLTHLGKCLVVHETHERALFESNMMKAHLADCVNPRYVEFYLRSRDGRTRLISGAKWAVNQASINQEDVKRTPLPLPPLAEQTRIVAEVERRLSVVEELESLVSANLQRATRLRQSILQKAFTGEL
jgi:type I restriction enzyme S subunit